MGPTWLPRTSITVGPSKAAPDKCKQNEGREGREDEQAYMLNQPTLLTTMSEIFLYVYGCLSYVLPIRHTELKAPSPPPSAEGEPGLDA